MNLVKAFATVSGLTMASRVLGLVREVLIAALLGAGAVADAFFVAFRFPNLFRRFFAEGAFNMAFVPLFAKRLEGDGPDAARRFAEEALAGLLSVVFVLVLAAQLAMPWFIFVIAYGFADDPERLSLAILFAQIQFPYLTFMSLTALFSGVLNALGKFAAAAGAPILLNLSMIGALSAAWALGAEIGLWLAWSVFIAGVLQFLLVARAAARAGMSLRLRAPRWTPDMKRLVALGVPGVIAGGVTQINVLVGTTIATFQDGAVAWITYADRVYNLPLGVVGVAIGVALLPELARRVRAGDQAGAGRAFNRAIEVSLALTLPAAVALMVVPDEIIGILFERGAFGPSDTAASAVALALYAAGLPAYVLNRAVSPTYFAEEDTKTPLAYAAVGMVINVALSLGLWPVMSWYAVPLAASASAWVNVALLWRGAGRRYGYHLSADARSRCLRLLMASALMGALVWGVADAFPAAMTAPGLRYAAVLGLVAFGVAAYFALAIAVGGVQLRELRAAFRRSRDAENNDPPA